MSGSAAKSGPEVLGVSGLTARLGFAYEPSASPDEYLSAMSVDLDKFIVGSGVAYEFDQYTVELTYAAVLMPSREITSSSVQQTSAARPPWNGRSIIGNGKYEEARTSSAWVYTTVSSNWRRLVCPKERGSRCR